MVFNLLPFFFAAADWPPIGHPPPPLSSQTGPKREQEERETKGRFPEQDQPVKYKNPFELNLDHTFSKKKLYHIGIVNVL